MLRESCSVAGRLLFWGSAIAMALFILAMAGVI